MQDRNRLDQCVDTMHSSPSTTTNNSLPSQHGLQFSSSTKNQSNHHVNDYSSPSITHSYASITTSLSNDLLLSSTNTTSDSAESKVNGQENTPLIIYGIALVDGISSMNQSSIGGRAKVIKRNSLKHSRGGKNLDFSSNISGRRSDLKFIGKVEGKSSFSTGGSSDYSSNTSGMISTGSTSNTSTEESGQISGRQLELSNDLTSSSPVSPHPFPSSSPPQSNISRTTVITSGPSLSKSSNESKRGEPELEKRTRKQSLKRIFKREPLEVEEEKEEGDQLEELSFELPKIAVGPRFSIGAVLADVVQAQDRVNKPSEEIRPKIVAPQSSECSPIYLHDLKRDARALLDSKPTDSTHSSTRKGIRRILPFLKEKKLKVKVTSDPLTLTKSISLGSIDKSISGSTPGSARKLQKMRPPMPTFPLTYLPSPILPRREEFRSTLYPTELPPLQYYTLPRVTSDLPSRNLYIPTPPPASNVTQIHRKSSSLPSFPTFVAQDRINPDPLFGSLTQQQIVSSLPITRRKKKGVHKVKNIKISDWVKNVEVRGKIDEVILEDEQEFELEKNEENDYPRIAISRHLDYPTSLDSPRRIDDFEFSPPTSAVDPMIHSFSFGLHSRSGPPNGSNYSLDVPRTPSLGRSSSLERNKFESSSFNDDSKPSVPLGSPIVFSSHYTTPNSIQNLPRGIHPPTHSPIWTRKRSTSLQISPTPPLTTITNTSRHVHQSSLSSIDEVVNDNKFSTSRPNHRRIPTLESISRTETDSELSSLSNFHDEDEDEIFNISSDTYYSDNNSLKSSSHQQKTTSTSNRNTRTSQIGFEQIQPVPNHAYVTLPTSSPSKLKSTSSHRPTPIFARFPVPPSRNLSPSVPRNDSYEQDEIHTVEENVVTSAQMAIRRTPSLVKTGSLSRNGSSSRRGGVEVSEARGREDQRREFKRETMGGRGAATVLREMLLRNYEEGM